MTWEDLTCGSLFSGPGLMDYGLHLAGIKHKWFVESIEFRRRLLALRFPGCEVHDDVRTFDAVRAPRVDVIAGGFPCRGVSTAGQRTGLAHPETDAERGGPREQPEPIAGRGCAPEHRQAAQFPWGRFGPAIRRWEAIAGAVPEPFLPRVAHGRPRGVDGPRVAALGDGVLVQAARYIGELLVELDRISTSGSL